MFRAALEKIRKILSIALNLWFKSTNNIPMQTNRLLVSVLLVTYNQEPFIRKAIEGVLSQVTAFPVELVIGEDASVDGTRRICEEYALRYSGKVTLLPARKNIGLNLNFLQTFASCKGKYIAYLEGDDWWISADKLQKQVDILESEEDVVLAHTNFKLFDLESKKYQHRLIRHEGQCIRELQAGLSGVLAEFRGTFRPMKTSTVCYRKDVMQTILDEDPFLFLNPEFPTQDFQLFQEMSLRGRFAFIDEDTTVILLHDSISAAQDVKKRAEFRLGFFKIGIYLVDKYRLGAEDTKDWFRRQLYFFFQDAFSRRDRSFLGFVVDEAIKRSYRLPSTQKVKWLVAQAILRSGE